MRVLCISPRFPPVNAADCHRLRLLLPHLAACGWDAEVLAVEPDGVPGVKDTWLETQLPAQVPVHRVPAWKISGWGWNGLAQRSLAALYREGCRLLASKSFDLVFFSTTEFLVHLLGPLWKRRFGVPFCMDFQDPWVTDYYREHPDVIPPGGRLKFALMSRIDRAAERWTVRDCGGFMAVSPSYLQDLDRRYGPAAVGKPRLVAAFPAEPAEQARVARTPVEASAPTRVWRYIGRGGADLRLAMRAFFRAWRRCIDAAQVPAEAIRFEAIGTSYSTSDSADPTVRSAAREEGMQAQVQEQTTRVGYGEMLALLQSSDALVVFGSDDPAYTASKIHPYLLAGKPLLVICNEHSPMRGLITQVAGATCIAFSAGMDLDALAERIGREWFGHGVDPRSQPLDREAFAPFTAQVQAVAVTRFFDAVVRHPS